MKTLGLAALVAASSLTPVLAADMGRPIYRAPIAIAAPAYMSWNGFYVGGNVGYGSGTARARDAVTGDSLGAFDTDGFVGGGQVGYNWQFHPNWVFGVEADIQGGSIRGSNVDFASKVTTYGTARGRIGYAMDNWLLYGTGGFAWGRNRVFDALSASSLSRTHTGYAVGGGLEYALSPQWSAKLEYLYVNLGRETYDFAAPVTARTDFHTVKLGVNYRFGGGPIVAAY